jgi:methylamine dehydrogenase accessory protein MauD
VSGWWLASYLVLWALLAGTIVVLLVVLRQLGLMYLRSSSGLRLDEGPEVGSIVPPFDEIDELTDDRFRIPDPEAPVTLLLFASPSCAICKDVLQGLAAVVHHYDGVSPVVISEGTAEENDGLRRMVGSKGRFVTSVARQRHLAIETIPYGVAVRRDGLVLARRIVNHLDDVENLLEDAAGEPRELAATAGEM